MNGELGEAPDDNSDHRHVKKLVHLRVDEPHAAPLRKRAKRFWKKNRRWLIPLVILTVGILVIWLSLRVAGRRCDAPPTGMTDLDPYTPFRNPLGGRISELHERGRRVFLGRPLRVAPAHP